MLGVGRILVDGNRVRPRKVTISKADKMNVNPCSFFLVCTWLVKMEQKAHCYIAATRHSSKI